MSNEVQAPSCELVNLLRHGNVWLFWAEILFSFFFFCSVNGLNNLIIGDVKAD